MFTVSLAARIGLRVVIGSVVALASAGQARAQQGPARRVASIVSVAMAEYELAVSPSGKLISDLEYEEAVTFLADARNVAARMSGERVPAVRALLDTLSAAVRDKLPPADLTGIHTRFSRAMGADAALEMPTKALDLAVGKSVYDAKCASCHGSVGLGDGAAGRELNPPPPALGDRAAMVDATPAIMFHKISVGVAGTAMAGFGSELSVDERWSLIAYLNRLRAPPMADPGAGLYLQRCASCHGMSGASDGEYSRALSRLPVELSSFGWQVERSDRAIASVIRNGVPGSAMPAAHELSEGEIQQLVAHVRSLGRAEPAATAESEGGAAVSTRVMGILDDALVAIRTGRNEEAADKAFDAYIAFEPLETPARARDPGMVASMERHFAEFKGAVTAGDVRGAERSRNAIEAEMPAVLRLIQPAAGFWGNVLQSFLIILREGVEAILVIGAIVAFLIKTGNRDRLRAVWLGVGAALIASAVTAVLLSTVLAALPATREIIEGVTMLVAVAVLFSVSYWMISKVEAARWQQFIRDKVNDALQHGGQRALVAVGFLAVYREGAETALFYQALLRDGAGVPIALGIVIGAAALTVIFILFYRYGVRLPLRPFFAVTSALLYYMAFVFMGKGIRELQEGNAVPITVLPGWPNVEALGIYPSLETLLGQGLLVLLFGFALVRTFWPRRSVALPTAMVTASAAPEPDRLAELERRLHELEDAVSVRAGETQ